MQKARELQVVATSHVYRKEALTFLLDNLSTRVSVRPYFLSELRRRRVWKWKPVILYRFAPFPYLVTEWVPLGGLVLRARLIFTTSSRVSCSNPSFHSKRYSYHFDRSSIDDLDYKWYREEIQNQEIKIRLSQLNDRQLNLFNKALKLYPFRFRDTGGPITRTTNSKSHHIEACLSVCTSIRYTRTN